MDKLGGAGVALKSTNENTDIKSGVGQIRHCPQKGHVELDQRLTTFILWFSPSQLGMSNRSEVAHIGNLIQSDFLSAYVLDMPYSTVGERVFVYCARAKDLFQLVGRSG